MSVLMYKDPVTSEWKPSGSYYGSGSTFVTMTMEASKWSGNTYSFEDKYPSNQYNISIEVSSAATDEQDDAFCDAKIRGSVNTNIATAKGDVPTVDIPIILGVAVK